MNKNQWLPGEHKEEDAMSAAGAKHDKNAGR